MAGCAKYSTKVVECTAWAPHYLTKILECIFWLTHCSIMYCLGLGDELLDNSRAMHGRGDELLTRSVQPYIIFLCHFSLYTFRYRCLFERLCQNPRSKLKLSCPAIQMWPKIQNLTSMSGNYRWQEKECRNRKLLSSIYWRASGSFIDK